jgi:hypothetical protein
MSFLVARIPFKSTSRDRVSKREFRPGQLIEGLDQRQADELVASGYALEVETQSELEALQKQISNLSYPGDDFPEMDLDLIDHPQAPVAARDPGAPVLEPPRYPLVVASNQLGPLGKC